MLTLKRSAGYAMGARIINDWELSDDGKNDHCLKIAIQDVYDKRRSPSQIEERYAEMVKDSEWIRHGTDGWVIDLTAVRQGTYRSKVKRMPNWTWLDGHVQLAPVLELGPGYGYLTDVHAASIVFYIRFETVATNGFRPAPRVLPEIADSLRRFRRDNPRTDRTAFLMMKFGQTQAHSTIVRAIRKAFAEHDITVMRADDKQYHDDLFSNVLTYVFGCAFGIALFERIEDDDINPNASLEVGYMLALGKPVCFLKDKTLRTLNTDLVGRLYKSFDPQRPTETITAEVKQWLTDKELLD